MFDDLDSEEMEELYFPEIRVDHVSKTRGPSTTAAATSRLVGAQPQAR